MRDREPWREPSGATQEGFEHRLLLRRIAALYAPPGLVLGHRMKEVPAVVWLDEVVRDPGEYEPTAQRQDRRVRVVRRLLSDDLAPVSPLDVPLGRPGA